MVDYSKWKDIEISDDEDDTHPNIDTPSLFRWRHQARLERMEQAKRDWEKFKAEKLTHQNKLTEMMEQLKHAEFCGDELKKNIAEMESKSREFEEKEEEFKKRERKTPWNVDTISRPGFDKIVLNKASDSKKNEDITEEEKEKRMQIYIKENENLIKKFGMLQKYEDSKNFLLQHQQLVCDDATNYLVIWCINLEIEKKHNLMHHVAHQCICMQYILESAKQLSIDPRACVASFFTKIQDAVVEYKEQFQSDINAFIHRIEKRAREKIEEAIKEETEHERKARLGPGGLDPVEVFASLPDELKKCFETRDIQLLQTTISSMPENEAKYHMKRCIASGMWIPDQDLKNSGGNFEGKNDGQFKEEHANFKTE